MAVTPDAARARAEANFKKEERAKEGAKAMTEYQDHNRLVREKTAKLRALRLAKEAAEIKAPEIKTPEKKKNKTPEKKKNKTPEKKKSAR